MNPEQAEHIADQLIQDAKSRRALSSARIARRVGALQRLYTGVATLTAAGGAFVAGQHWFSSALWAAVFAVVCGLFAAVAWQPNRPRA
jgi:hypothetical protein